MAHKVRLTERAYAELDEIVAYIAQNAPIAALTWRDSVWRKVDSLEHFPLRHGLAPEAEAAGADIRQTLLGVYRILYRVSDDWVTVCGIRHGARRPMRPDELPEG